MKRFFKLFFIVFIFFVVWELSGVFEYVKQCAEYNTNKEIPESPDMVVALTGGARRLPEAFKLMNDIDAKHLLISGVDPKVSFEKLASTYGWDMSLKDKVLLDYASQTTFDNAKITLSFVKDFNVKKLVLVTSVYHMKRAHYMFTKSLENAGVEIITYSVYAQPIDPLNWWKERNAFLLVMEYLKFEQNRLVQVIF